MWSIYTIEYYSAIKRNEALIQATTWMNLEDIMLGKRSQTQNTTCCIIHSIYTKYPEEVNLGRQKVDSEG